MKIKMAREAIIAKLEEKVSVAKTWDEAKLAEHYARNGDIAAKRRTFIEERILSLDDNELAELRAYDMRRFFDNLPNGSTCPLSKVKQFESELKMLRMDTRKIITVGPGDELAQLLSFELNAEPAELC